MNKGSIAFLWLATLLVACVPASAHHGAAAYDESKEVVLKNATVTKYTWANPHTIIEADVKDDKGNVVHWVGEVGSPFSNWQSRLDQGFHGDRRRNHDVHTSIQNGQAGGRVSHVVLADGTQLRDSSGTSGVGGGEGGGGYGGRGRGGDSQN